MRYQAIAGLHTIPSGFWDAMRYQAFTGPLCDTLHVFRVHSIIRDQSLDWNIGMLLCVVVFNRASSSDDLPENEWRTLAEAEMYQNLFS